MINVKKYEQFLKELSELSKKHGVYIAGCGCCNSPYLTEVELEDSDGELCWDKDKKEYYI